MEGPRVGKDSLIVKKVVKLKAFIYINHKDKLCVDCDSIAFDLTSRMNLVLHFYEKAFWNGWNSRGRRRISFG